MGSVWSLFNSILNLTPQFLHCGNSGRSAGVDQHGRIEVSVLEHAGDMLQMVADLVAAARVTRIVGECLDASAVLIQTKVMRCLLVCEAHHLITALHDACVVLVGCLLCQLECRPQY